MRFRASLYAVVSIGMWMLAVAASAQTPPESAAEVGVAAKTGADAEGETGPAAEARRLYAEGRGEYAQGRFAQAIVLFERAYGLSEAPGLLFNMAQAHRLAGEGHCAQAMALYKSYLAALPTADNRREVEERIEALNTCATEPVPTAPDAPKAVVPAPPEPRDARALTAPPPPPPPPTTSARPRLGPALVAGVGLAMLVAGGIVYGKAYEKHREAERECPCYPGTYAKWERLTNLSYAAIGVGGAMLAGGVSWWVIGAPASLGAPAHASLNVGGRF